MKYTVCILWVFTFLAGCGAVELREDAPAAAPGVVEPPEEAAQKQVTEPEVKATAPIDVEEKPNSIFE